MDIGHIKIHHTNLRHPNQWLDFIISFENAKIPDAVTMADATWLP